VQINPYLFFNGDCEAAFKFYEKALDGKILAMLPHEGTPAAEHVPADWRKKIMHAAISIGENTLMASDTPEKERPQGFSVSLQVNEPDKAEKVFKALAEDGKVQMPIQETFWAERFGMVVDRFGIPWMINCSKAA
jgi:PhnB protein